jgi:uncharacterized protein (TIGR03435 family)
MRSSCERCIGLALFAMVLASAQTIRPVFSSFEVATIKPAGPDDPKAGRYIRMQSAHRFEVRNYTANGLIAAAYDLNPQAISGGPPWLGSDRYEIRALVPGDLRPTYDEQMAMLRKLLADRFHLSFHREKKEFSIYELTVAKGGPKITASTAPFDEASNVTSTLYPASSGGIDHALMPAHNVTMREFASVLQRAILDRPVVDRTELSGRYDFNLEWTPDDSQFGGQLPSGAPDSDRPGLFTAVQQQLGLRIEAARGPLEALVIDRLERPSAD